VEEVAFRGNRGSLPASVIDNSDRRNDSTAHRAPVSALRHRRRRLGAEDKWNVTFVLLARRSPTVESDGVTCGWQVPQRIDRHVTPRCEGPSKRQRRRLLRALRKPMPQRNTVRTKRGQSRKDETASPTTGYITCKVWSAKSISGSKVECLRLSVGYILSFREAAQSRR